MALPQCLTLQNVIKTQKSVSCLKFLVELVKVKDACRGFFYTETEKFSLKRIQQRTTLELQYHTNFLIHSEISIIAE